MSFDTDTAAASSAAAADFINSLNDRVAIGTAAAGLELAGHISTLSSSIAASGLAFRSAARRLCAHRSQWFGKHEEEVEAAEKLLLACTRVIDSSSTPLREGVDPAVLWACLQSVSPLLDDSSTVLRRCCIIDAPNFLGGVSPALQLATRVQDSMDVARCVWSGPGISWCHTGTGDAVELQNTVRITFVDGQGDPIRTLRPSDVYMSLLLPGSKAPAGTFSPLTLIDANTIEASYTLGFEGKETKVQLQAMLFGGVYQMKRVVTVGCEVAGKQVASLMCKHADDNAGIAVSDDGTLMAVSNWGKNSISVYSLPGGEWLRDFGSKGTACGRFDQPWKLTFTPDANIVVAEFGNHRAQEVSSRGDHVKFYQTEDSASCYGVAATATLVALAQLSKVKPIALFDRASGNLIRRFSAQGKGSGQVSNTFALRFTADASALAVVNNGSVRICLFSVDGTYLRSIGPETGMRQPRDALFASNGDLIVSDTSRQVILVISPEGETRRTFGGSPGLSCPTALAYHDRRLYVLDRGSKLVQVFE